MPRSGGTYTLPAGNPVVTGTVGTSAWANGTMADVGSELTNSIPRDGTAPPTANLPIGGFKLTGLAAGTVAGDALRFQQLYGAGPATALAARNALELPQSPFVNRFANGGMRFDQTNSGGIVTVNSASQFDSVDCVAGFGAPAAGTFTVQQIGAGAPPGYSAFTRVTRGTQDASPAAGSLYQVVGFIEGLDIADLQWQSANALAVSYQFMFRTSLTGARTWGGSIRNNTGGRSYPVTWATAAANTWTTITLPNIPGDTAGTWLADNQRSMLLTIDVGAGASGRGTANAWAASNLIGVTGTERLISSAAADTFDFTGIQLERGPVCTPFETMPVPAQEIRVFRYLRRRRATVGNQLVMAGTNNFNTSQQLYADPLPVHMRVGPSVSYSASSDFTVYTNAVAGAAAVTLQIAASDPASVMHQTANAAMGAAMLASANGNAFILYAARL